jgi:hypothetical protein
MNIINKLKSLIAYSFLLICLSGCAWFAGGAQYDYHYQDPTGKTVDVSVSSAREIGLAAVQFSPTGEVTIAIEGMTPGANNLGQALGIIDGLIKTGTMTVAP